MPPKSIDGSSIHRHPLVASHTLFHVSMNPPATTNTTTSFLPGKRGADPASLRVGAFRVGGRVNDDNVDDDADDDDDDDNDDDESDRSGPDTDHGANTIVMEVREAHLVDVIKEQEQIAMLDSLAHELRAIPRAEQMEYLNERQTTTTAADDSHSKDIGGSVASAHFGLAD